MKITDKKNITRNLDMKVNLRGGGQINLKPLAQIADSVEPKNYRDITVTGLTPEELDSEAVKESIRTYGLSEEEMGKIPHIDFNSLGRNKDSEWDTNTSYCLYYEPINNSDTFPTVEGSIPLTTSSIFNTEYILYGDKSPNVKDIVLKLEKISGNDDIKYISYLSASGTFPIFSIEFTIKEHLFKDTCLTIGLES